MPFILSEQMKNYWIITAALCLAGCASNSDSAPETTAEAPAPSMQPQVVATLAPPVVVAPTLAPAPTAPALTESDHIAPTTDEQARETVEEKQRQVESLRSDIRLLQTQRRTVEDQKRQFGTRNPNADANERALGADSPNDVQMAQYNERLDDIDRQLASKQKQIDDLMLSR